MQIPSAPTPPQASVCEGLDRGLWGREEKVSGPYKQNPRCCTPIATLKSITGHFTYEMDEHYTHIRDKAKRKAVEALDAANGGIVQ